jgi:hypothetical protein
MGNSLNIATVQACLIGHCQQLVLPSLALLHHSALTSLLDTVGAHNALGSTFACLVLSAQGMRTVDPAHQNTDHPVACVCADQRPKAPVRQAGEPRFGGDGVHLIPSGCPRGPAYTKKSFSFCIVV